MKVCEITLREVFLDTPRLWWQGRVKPGGSAMQFCPKGLGSILQRWWGLSLADLRRVTLSLHTDADDDRLPVQLQTARVAGGEQVMRLKVPGHGFRVPVSKWLHCLRPHRGETLHLQVEYET